MLCPGRGGAAVARLRGQKRETGTGIDCSSWQRPAYRYSQAGSSPGGSLHQPNALEAICSPAETTFARHRTHQLVRLRTSFRVPTLPSVLTLRRGSRLRSLTFALRRWFATEPLSADQQLMLSPRHRWDKTRHKAAK